MEQVLCNDAGIESAVNIAIISFLDDATRSTWYREIIGLVRHRDKGDSSEGYRTTRWKPLSNSEPDQRWRKVEADVPTHLAERCMHRCVPVFSIHLCCGRMKGDPGEAILVSSDPGDTKNCNFIPIALKTFL